MSWLATLSLSVAGSVIGGFVGSVLWNGKIEFLPGGFFVSVLGAILVLLIVHKISRGTVVS
ncbi:MAG TPA: GlsB/YeaQ/YmgE family stress response membrane protein [Pyrinomonadaceae bacterium]|nr:GlsB/YeaQ/YmgE family stress response membrane protein [Pyrinomonadaceae bacterium]